LVVAFVTWCLREPTRVALPIFASLVPFGESLSLGSSRFGSVSSLMGMLVALGLALRLATTRRSAPRLSPSIPIWLLFGAAAALSSVWTIDHAATYSDLTVLGSLLVVFVLVVTSDVDRAVLRRTENGLLVGGAAAVSYGLYELVSTGGFTPDTTTSVTPDARFGNNLLGPGILAVSLVLPLVIALSRAFKESGAGRRLMYGLLGVLILWGILMTGSRTGSLAVCLALVTLAFSGPKVARRGMLVCLGIGVTIGAAVWLFHPAGVATRSFATATSSSGRTDIWQVGLSSCPKYCAFGAGWGTFPEVYAETQALVPGAKVLVGANGSYQPHNIWLLALVELGVTGIVLLTWGLGVSVVEAVRLPAELRGPPLSALVGLLFGGLFLSSMDFKYFWMVLMLVAMNRNVAQAEQAEQAEEAEESRATAASTQLLGS
jgi:O-antigen ligase